MTNSTDQKVFKSLHHLKESNKKEFVEWLYSHDKFINVIQSLSAEYVEEELPIVGEEYLFNMALLLFDSITLKCD